MASGTAARADKPEAGKGVLVIGLPEAGDLKRTNSIRKSPIAPGPPPDSRVCLGTCASGKLSA